MKPKRCSTSQLWSQILLVIFDGVIASQNSGKLENQQNQINPSVPQLHNQSQIKSIFEASEALEALIYSFYEAQGLIVI